MDILEDLQQAKEVFFQKILLLEVQESVQYDQSCGEIRIRQHLEGYKQLDLKHTLSSYLYITKETACHLGKTNPLKLEESNEETFKCQSYYTLNNYVPAL